MAMRVAISSFGSEIAENGLGDDIHGEEMNESDYGQHNQTNGSLQLPVTIVLYLTWTEGITPKPDGDKIMRDLTKTEMVAIERQALAFHWDDERKEKEIAKKAAKKVATLSTSARRLNSMDCNDESGMF